MSNTETSSSSSSPSSSSPISLKKQLGLLNGVGILVGIVVGSGIFVSPKGVIMETESLGACLLVWVLCGLVCMAGALCYAELGTCLPTSGADYAYIMKTWGDLPAFLWLWVALVVVVPAGNAIIALTFSGYLLQTVFPDCPAPPSAVPLLAALCICFLTFVNSYSTKWATRIQDVFACTKVFALVIIIGVGLVKICMGATDNFERPFEGTTRDPGRLALAFYSGLFSFSGWNSLNLVTEELKEPNKNLPRAICISLPLVTVIYFLANVAYFGVMSPAEMVASDAVAVTFADRTLGPVSSVVPILVACSTFGSLNGIIYTNSRLYFVAARHGHLPGFLATINLKHLTPLPSLLFGCVTSLLWLTSSDVFTLINYASFAETIFMALVVAGLILLRFTHPELKRPIKVNMAIPVLFLIACAFLVLTPIAFSPKECLMSLVLTLTGIPVYALGVRWKRKPASFISTFGTISNFSQKLLFAVPEDGRQD